MHRNKAAEAVNVVRSVMGDEDSQLTVDPDAMSNNVAEFTTIDRSQLSNLLNGNGTVCVGDTANGVGVPSDANLPNESAHFSEPVCFDARQQLTPEILEGMYLYVHTDLLTGI